MARNGALPRPEGVRARGSGPLAGIGATALLAALSLLPAHLAAQPWSDPGPGIGVQGGADFSAKATGANASLGLHYRFRLTGGLGIEAAAAWRRVTYEVSPGGYVRMEDVPVTGALLLFPWPDHPVQPYALAGAGYYLVRLRGENVPNDVDGTENQFGFLAGAGVEAQVGPRVSLFLDGRYTFLPVDALQAQYALQARYTSVTFGVTYRY